MKIKSLVFTMITLLSPLTFALDEEESLELYDKGTITVYDENGRKLGHYVVPYIPGAANIRSNQKLALAALGKAFTKITDKTWDKEFLWQFVEKGQSMVRASRAGIDSIPLQYQQMRRLNANASKEFSAGVLQAGNVLMFGLMATSLMLYTAIGAGAGAACATIVPAALVVLPPVVYMQFAIVLGIIWPTLSFTWNGVAWVITAKTDNKPKHDSKLIYYVPSSH